MATERAGPPLTGDHHAGFGTKLISRVIAYDLHGQADLHFDREGLRCVLSSPMPVERGQGLGPALARIRR